MYAYVSLPRHRAARASLLRRAELSEPPCIPLPSPCGALAAIARRSRVPRGVLPAAAWSYPGRRASLPAAARSYHGHRVSLSLPPWGAHPAAEPRSLAAVRSSPGRHTWPVTNPAPPAPESPAMYCAMEDGAVPVRP